MAVGVDPPRADAATFLVDKTAKAEPSSPRSVLPEASTPYEVSARKGALVRAGMDKASAEVRRRRPLS